MNNGNYGNDFQEKSKYIRGHLKGRGLDWENKPKIYKKYPNCPKTALPSPFHGKHSINVNITEIFKQRRSVRVFQELPVKIEQISYLLWASTGIQRNIGNFAFRTAPSAGALYPIETYILINNCQELDHGIYHYDIQNHSLDQIKEGKFSIPFAQGALDQRMVAMAPMVFIWTAIFQRSKWKYQQRTYRYIYLDAGHIAAHLSLAAIELGLGTCQIAAFYDNEINDLLNIDGEEESTLYLSVVGSP
ncbi:SagB/ThcOx family dehydrogenase [Promethearchaeum syntrophicum]|uniref:SagB/ThcOx family dehydrogenase n=1 Tax=Promethearchaeum syntrophicum TaxID=2594042 RepID=A0A5B9DCL2_9ARCH|nr:SagB/ThcOx family dehydrogenase [Candidatus Prometheoarchaeum syntrophicum]QEE16948.1 Nitroreductase family protein [Candidatus Prometheoarchaeum syntrophicum]